MGHPIRMYRHREVAFVTNRLARGLPLVPTRYINRLLFGLLARAQMKNPHIVVCAWLFLANHYHAILLNLGSAEDLRAFMNYIDGELAKMICKLLGRWNIKVWAQRFHYAPLLSAADCMEKMKYTFLNPVEANQVEFARNYPGASTLPWVLDLQHRERFQWVKPSLVETLANAPFRRKTSKRLAAALSEMDLPTYELQVQPFAWKHCYADTTNCSDEQLRAELLDQIAMREKEIARERRRKKQQVCDLVELMEQNPHRHYIPKKYGKRARCISSCPILRQEYIELYKDFCEKCAIAWQRAKAGYCEVAFPPGAFIPPQLPRACEICYVT